MAHLYSLSYLVFLVNNFLGTIVKSGWQPPRPGLLWRLLTTPAQIAALESVTTRYPEELSRRSAVQAEGN